jgi:hypothetical protein
MGFARWVFTIGGIYGVIVIAPLLFLETFIARTSGPFTHPETYYGFVGTALAWQLVYLLTGRDPARYRPLMPIGALGKTIFGGSAWVLYAMDRVPLSIPLLASVDLVLAALFVAAYFKTPKT